MDAIETIEHNGFKIRIMPDDDPMNPREWDNLGIMNCWHRRYNLGDKHKHDAEGFQDWLDDPENEVVAYLPLYLYDHSGITISTGPFSCRFDSGQVGFIYTTKDRIKNMFGETVPSEEQLLEGLKAEVKEYDKFISNGYVGFIVEDSEGNQVESCWGFSDKDQAIEDAKGFCRAA